MTFEEEKEMFKKSIDTTDTMNQAIENFIQSIYLKGYNDALNTAKVEPQPKMGRWIALENRFELGSRVKCSECDQIFVVGDDVSRNYCPNCGRRMVEPQESEG